ncbi:formyl peptide receptor 2-like [Anomaloglossus baeobatrachus]|uniref:formyl peptide receptor 2-like n=1 Tax=Anomaloglossus baeobatrachus TaxID=238106 RepID=UPI003F50C8A8
MDDYYYYRSCETRTRNYFSIYEEDILVNISITLYSITCILGIIGNGLVIWIAGFRMKKTISAVWFLHLAIADFLCCASIPLRVGYRSYFAPGFLCIMNIFLFNVNMTSSVLLLTAMSIDRWVSVMWPFWAKVHRTCKLVRISAAIIWGLSLLQTGLLFFLFMFYFEDVTEWCITVSFTSFHLCKIRQTVRLIRLLSMCVIPFIVIFTSYVTIFCKLRKSKRSQRSQRSSRIITAVISCFFICWFPYYIWPLTPFYDGYTNDLFIVTFIVTIMACLNSCMNPIIYVFMGSGFRQGFFRSIPARVERALSEHPNDLCREGEDAGNTRSTDV